MKEKKKGVKVDRKLGKPPSLIILSPPVGILVSDCSTRDLYFTENVFVPAKPCKKNFMSTSIRRDKILHSVYCLSQPHSNEGESSLFTEIKYVAFGWVKQVG